ncbi:MAG: ABC transporter permease subunit, partial [Oscillospiraceae bacterium]
MARLYASRDPDLTILPGELVTRGLGMAFPKGSDLTAQFNREIARLKQSGVLDEMADKWMGAADHVMLPELASTGENGTLRVACTAATEPMCYVGVDGALTGYDVELLMHIAQALGKKVVLIPVDFGGLTAMLESGKADVVMGCLTISDERCQLVDMTDSYYDGGIVMLARGTPLESANSGVMTGAAEHAPVAEGEYTALSQLSGKLISSTTGSIFDRLIPAVIPDVQFAYFNNATDELTALRAGKVEGMPMDGPVAELWCAQNSDLAIVPELVAEDYYAIALAKGSPLTADFNREIAALKAQGVLDEMYDKWISADERDKTMPSLDYPAQGGTIRVACSAALEPMCYAGAGGVPMGFDVELVIRVAQTLGKKVELTCVDFGGLMPMLQSGKADVAVGCISVSEERRQSVDLTDPYYDGGMRMVVRKAGSAPEDIGFWSGLKQSFIRTFVTENRWKLVLDGLVVTVVLSICSGILGSVLGFGLCMLRRSKRRLSSVPTAVFIRIIQGTPIVVLLMILYYIIFGKLDISAMLVAILGFAVNFGVYVSEMMRTGIDAVDKGQIEAAHALGFTRMRTFWKITFPQAARHFLPVFKGEFISMVKMTSVVGYIAIQDLTKVSDI